MQGTPGALVVVVVVVEVGIWEALGSEFSGSPADGNPALGQGSKVMPKMETR